MTSLKPCLYVLLLVIATYGLPVKHFTETEEDGFKKDVENLEGFYSKLSNEKYINLMEQQLENEKDQNEFKTYSEGISSNTLIREESDYATNILIRDKRNLDDVTINELPTVHKHAGESTPMTTESHIEVLYKPGEHAGVEHKGGDEHKDEGGSDSGGFLGSFLPTVLGAASSLSSGGSDKENGSGFWSIFGQILQIKMAIIRSIIAIISSLSSSSTH